MSNKPGVLYIVATPIGNLGDITFRAVEILGQVDRIIAEDTRHSKRLLQHYAIKTPMQALHEHNERQINDRMLDLLHNGSHLALISDAGTPLISDPGFPLVRACREQNINVVPIPGPSALLAALSVSGMPTDRFTFEGFLPRTQQTRQQKLLSLRKETRTLVFYESSHRIQHALADMLEVLGAERQVCVARELTKQFEDVFCGTLAELTEQVAVDPNRRKGEFVLVVAGDVVADENDLPPEVTSMLEILVKELPVRQAAKIASEISGVKKNRLYQAALEFRGK